MPFRCELLTKHQQPRELSVRSRRFVLALDPTIAFAIKSADQVKIWRFFTLPGRTSALAGVIASCRPVSDGRHGAKDRRQSVQPIWSPAAEEGGLQSDPSKIIIQ